MTTLFEYFWIMLILYGVFRSLILRFSPYRKQYLDLPLTVEELQIYHNQRTHMITLASFVIVGISIIIALPKEGIDAVHDGYIQDSLVYLSIGMVTCFIGSYLFSTITSRWFPFTGETLEYIGIMSIGVGLFSMIQFLTIEFRVIIVYIAFLIGIVLVTGLDLYYNKHIFLPEKKEDGDEDDE